MENFSSEVDVFEFFYPLAVGYERLLKVAIILSEHDPFGDTKKFEKGLKTHSHEKLVKCLENTCNIKFLNREKEFISILTEFYKSDRYNRFNFEPVFNTNSEPIKLTKFIQKHFKDELYPDVDATAYNSIEHCKFIGEVVSNIVNPIYEIVQKQAEELGIFITEIDYLSKASKIFLWKEFNFEDEDILQAEIMFYLLKDSFMLQKAQQISKHIRCLPFEYAEEDDLLMALRSDKKKIIFKENQKTFYEESEEIINLEERLEYMYELMLKEFDCEDDEDICKT
ncbi:hypothetical protein [Bartonella tamiae]|uniref:Uncharacterized protein n=1 Tax=Bartonella tamiae Th239 TaxID=1094558 RepID=J1JZX0_9HYPH|nr:hypothetical protein [Bartonella tamiae]EJF90305.1 hypothetical protein ME5_00706 [Bartonella tamiae Th239]EJF93754.1 hypothetical protein MEG_01178 [Bartonella tamiae Th307]